MHFWQSKYSFINQMADLCENVGADVHDVARGMGLDKRIGSRFLRARTRIWWILFSKGY